MKVPEKIYLYTEGNTLDNDWLYEAPEEFIVTGKVLKIMIK